jgi:hypothetical protein
VRGPAGLLYVRGGHGGVIVFWGPEIANLALETRFRKFQTFFRDQVVETCQTI